MLLKSMRKKHARRDARYVRFGSEADILRCPRRVRLPQQRHCVRRFKVRVVAGPPFASTLS